MTLQEAEEMYKYCLGNEGYYMWHECGAEAVEEYSKLNITRDIKAAWDRDIIEKYLPSLEDDSEYASSAFNNVMEALKRQNCTDERYAGKVLTLLEENASKYDVSGRIFIILNMGEKTLFSMSGCEYFCLHTIYGDRLDVVMEKMMNFDCPDAPALPKASRSRNLQDLYKQAVTEYCRSYAKFSGKQGDPEQRIEELCRKNCVSTTPRV